MASSNSIRRATTALASGTMVSRVLGFGRSWVLVQALGATGFAADAFNTANQAPNTIYAIISQGLLNAVLIPQLVRAATRSDGGREYTNRLVSLGMVAFAVVTVIATLLSPVWIFLYHLRGEQAQLATEFAYWSLPQIFFYGLYSLLGEVLNSRKSFGPFTWAPALNNVVSLASLGVFLLIGGRASSLTHLNDWSHLRVAVLAGGATLGIVAQALILFFFWRGVGLRFRFDLHFRGMGFRSVGKAAGWTFAMLLVSQIVGVVETGVMNTVSRSGVASSAASANTWLVFMLPHSIIAVSLVTAYFTRMAEHARDHDMPAFRADFSAAARGIILTMSVSAAVLIVGAYPFSRVFTSDYTAYGNVLIAYLIGLVPFSLNFVTLRAFYSFGDTRSPFVYTLVQSLLIAVGLAFCLLLPAQIRTAGVALSVSLATIVQTVIALIVLNRRLGGIDVRGITRALVKGFIAAFCAVIGGLFVLWVLGGLHAGGFAVAHPVSAIVSLIPLGLIMLVVYAIALFGLSADELTDLTRTLLRRRR